MKEEKVSHLMKGVAEDIYQALLTREINDIANFIKWCNYIEDMKQKRVGRLRFERLPNVIPVASLTDETDLVSLICTIVREVRRLVNHTQESLDSDPQYQEKLTCGKWLTTDLSVSTVDVLDKAMRYCRERKVVFDNYRNHRQNFDGVDTEEEIRRPNSARRSTPSPTRGRSPIRRFRSPSPDPRSSQSPCCRREEN
ncbi:retrotrans_gag domain-containing protein [Trichonephila clavipes]|nr:retrotrans_gag domain-containing protein [Trichonephila clavipes]